MLQQLVTQLSGRRLSMPVDSLSASTTGGKQCAVLCSAAKVKKYLQIQAQA